MEPKYELTEERNDQGLYRIRALRDFGCVSKGTAGGWVEGEHNLSHGGNCWVAGDACVFGDALVFEDAQVLNRAQVYGMARVYGDARVCSIACVSGDARVFGNACVSRDARCRSGNHDTGTIDS